MTPTFLKVPKNNQFSRKIVTLKQSQKGGLEIPTSPSLPAVAFFT